MKSWSELTWPEDMNRKKSYLLDGKEFQSAISKRKCLRSAEGK